MPLLTLRIPLLTSLRKFNLNSIVYCYLQNGHIQNEGDILHASIEHACIEKHPSIYHISLGNTDKHCLS